MHAALDHLANHLLLAASGTDLRTDELVRNGTYKFSYPAGLPAIRLRDTLHDALGAPRLQIRTLPAPIARDIVVDDLIPGPKRVSLTMELWRPTPTVRVFVDCEARTTARSGPYGAAFELDFLPPGPLHSLTRDWWTRGFMMAAFPSATREQVGPAPGVAFVGEAWPAAIDGSTFGYDEVRVTTVYDPRSGEGAVESVELTFSSPVAEPPLPRGHAVPEGIPRVGIFESASPDGVSVTLRFGPGAAFEGAEMDGALVFEGSELPLHWSHREPERITGSFDDEDEPFRLSDLGGTQVPLASILDGLDAVLIHQAELSCDLATGELELTGQCNASVAIAGVQCSDLVVTLRGCVRNASFDLRVAMCRGIAALSEETYFRAALVRTDDGWVSALEANHSAQKKTEEVSLATVIGTLPRYATPHRSVADFSPVPQVLQLDEQWRGSENWFDELIGEPTDTD